MHVERSTGEGFSKIGMGAEQAQPSELVKDLFAQGLRSNGILRVLKTVRRLLAMDVAYISHFGQSHRVLEHVDMEGPMPFSSGDVLPLDQGYCLRVANGELPEVIPDTSALPGARDLPDTSNLHIGAHLGVPIRLQNGQLFGTLCCFSHVPDQTLGAREQAIMHAFADVLAAHIDGASYTDELRTTKVNLLHRAMDAGYPHIVHQPIYDFKTGALAGLECLSRFGEDAQLTTSQWFEMAGGVELRQELEVLAIRHSLDVLPRFPPSLYLGINSSPETILNGSLAKVLAGQDLSRLIIEITEHATVEDYHSLSAALQPRREQGLRLAIDDAGAGYASMRHIVSLAPDVIKLDISLVRGIDRDPIRCALTRALIAFSREIGSHITAEGIETQGEFDTLYKLGVDSGQGFFLKEPLALGLATCPDVLSWKLPDHTSELPLPD